MKVKNDIKFKIFAGNPHKGEWAGVHFYSPQVPAIYEQRGDIAAVISLAGPANFDSSKAGNMLIDYLHETYFESEAESCLDALAEAVKNVKQRLVDLMVNDEVSSETGVEISLIAASIEKDVLYLAQLGEAKIYALRKDEMVDFSEYLKDPAGKSMIKTGSAILEPEDRLLLLSAEADFNLTPKEKLAILEKFNLDSVESKMFSNESLISTLILGYEISTEEIEIQELKPEPEIVREPEQVIQDEEYETEVIKTEAEPVISAGTQSPPKFDLSQLSSKFNRIKRDQKTKTFMFIISSIAVGIFNFLIKLVKFVWNDVLKMNSGMYLKSASRKNMNWRPIVFAGLILIITGIVIFKVVSDKKQAAKIALDNKLAVEKIENDINNISVEIDILIKTVGKEVEKTEKLGQLDELKKTLATVTLDEYKAKKDELDSQLTAYQNKLVRKIEVKDPKIIKDFAIYEGADPADFVISGDKIFVADKEGGKLFSMDFEGGNIKSYGENLERPKTLSVYDDKELVFVDENEERGVGVIDIETSKTDRLPGLSKTRLGNVNEMTIYKVGEGDIRMYATRESTKELIQLRRGTTSFGLPELRLTRSDFTNLVDLDVHTGRIYVLSEGQGVRRFLGDTEFGKNVEGMLNGDNWNSASSMAVDNDYIYLGDSANKRILVYTKSRGDNSDILDFVAQYDLSGVEGSDLIKEVVALESKDRLYILAGSRLVELDLKELTEFVY